MNNQPQPLSRVRVKLALRGAVQGVGFRPFVHRLATELAVTGWVNNSPQGVFVEAESPRPTLEQFLRRLEAEKPPRSSIQSMETTWLDAVGFEKFEIRASENGGGKSALVLPDLATCPDCLREIFDPQNRRFRYPFTNCTHCGPRFSIIEALPYDRANTSMKKFAMCPACQAEYDNPRRPPVSRAAERVSGLRSAPGILGCGRRSGLRRRRSAAGRRQRDSPRKNCRGQGHWRISSAGGCAQRKDRPAFARTQTPRGKTVCADVSFAGKREDGLRSFAAGRTAAAVRRKRRLCCCRKIANRQIGNRKFRRSRQSQSRRDAAVQSAAPSAAGGIEISRHRHQRQLERRADLHGRNGGARTAARHRRFFPGSQPPDCPPCGRFDCPRDAGPRNDSAPRPRLRAAARSIADCGSRIAE